MDHATPESIGISSKDVLRFIRKLDDWGLSTHSVVMARENSIFCESYWYPFDVNFKHRMYSVSKTFVSVAIEFCIQDALISEEDSIKKYFSEYMHPGAASEYAVPTVRDLLQMESSVENGTWWFETGGRDRTEVYLRDAAEKIPGTLFTYDSSGSYILGVIVENVTGKPFLKYLQEKVLDDIGFSKDAYCLKVPGGHSFGDSGVMCTSLDLLLFARFLLNGGSWEGKQYLDAEYVKRVTNTCVCSNDFGFYDSYSYGYGCQIWGAPYGGFSMRGMGTQIALCLPHKDLILIVNSDNQGNMVASDLIYEAFCSLIVDRMVDGYLPEDSSSYAQLQSTLLNERLFFLPGKSASAFSELINGRIFHCHDNPMKIKWFRLSFAADTGKFEYENRQGKKEFVFGFGHNEFAAFPQSGYADMIAGVPEDGHRYAAAFSADWPEEKKLRIRVQIIDKYFGNLAIVFGFADENQVSVRMVKSAEAFLDEYQGIMNAYAMPCISK
ncbi:MAG: serine hydrolase domain-containing protein [Eubacteriales bacterium]